MAQIQLNTIQIVHKPKYEKILIQVVNMGHEYDVNKRHIPNSSHVASIQYRRVVITKCQQNNLVSFMKIKPEMKIDIEKKGKRGSEGSKALRHIHSLR